MQFALQGPEWTFPREWSGGDFRASWVCGCVNLEGTCDSVDLVMEVWVLPGGGHHLVFIPLRQGATRKRLGLAKPPG